LSRKTIPRSCRRGWPKGKQVNKVDCRYMPLVVRQTEKDESGFLWLLLTLKGPCLWRPHETWPFCQPKRTEHSAWRGDPLQTFSNRSNTYLRKWNACSSAIHLTQRYCLCLFEADLKQTFKNPVLYTTLGDAYIMFAHKSDLLAF